MDADFVIVGGGIGGAVLGHLLADAGKRVLVVERNRTPPRISRPEILWPATVARLRPILGSVPENHWRLPLEGVRFLRGEQTLLAAGGDVFRAAGVRPNSTDPARTRELLLQAGRFELHRGVEVVSVLRENGRVAGVCGRDLDGGGGREYRAAWTVGDDGVHSLVRQACGIELHTELFPVDFLTFGFDWPATLPPAVGHVWLNEDRAETGLFALLAAPIPDNRGAGLLFARPDACGRSSQLNADIRAFRARSPRIADVIGDRAFPHDLFRVRRPWGHAAAYGAPGAILIGDAAHPVSPAGGQGANMSVADAAAVAEVVAEGVADIPAEYERRRRAANERSMGFTRTAVRALSLPGFIRGGLNRLLPTAMRMLNRRPDLLGRVLSSAASAFQGAE